MDPYDLLVLLSELLALAIWLKNPERLKIRLFVVFLPVALVLVQALILGAKWQMVPAYLVAFLLAAFSLGKFRTKKIVRITSTILGFLLVLFSGLASYTFPVFEFPEPDGNYSVGTTYLHFKDTDRKEFISPDPGDNRELMVRVWYPSDDRSGREAFQYMPPSYATTFSRTKGFPGFMLSHLDLVETNSFQDLSIANNESSFPVIIFAHGYMWHSCMYTAQMEYLASHGYVVFSIDFTYETPISIFPNQEVRYHNQVFIDTIWQDFSYDLYLAKQDSFQREEDFLNRISIMKDLMDYAPYSQRIDHMALDVKFVMNQLEAIIKKPNGPFYQKLDLERIGVMGHSLGGAVAGVACSIDARIRAGINLDGTQWGSLIHNDLDAPFLFMTAVRDSSYFDPSIFIYDVAAKNDYYNMTIEGSTHANFGDVSFWSNWNYISQTGPIDGDRVIQIINRYTDVFFKKYLNNQPNTILDAESHEFPEVAIRKELLDKSIKVQINENVELLGFVYFLGFQGEEIETNNTVLWESEGQPVTRKDWYSYAYDLYLQYKPHASSEYLDQAFELTQNIWLDHLINLLIQVDDFPNAKLPENIQEKYISRFSENGDVVEARENATAFLEAMNQFYREVEFGNYLTTHKAHYNNALNQVKKGIPSEDFIPAMEAFYQNKFERYMLIPSLTIPTGMGFGTRYTYEEETKIFNVFGPLDLQNFKNGSTLDMGFANRDRLRELSTHEFGHSFVNLVFDQIPQELIEVTKKLFDPIQEEMSDQGYNTWRLCLSEHMVRAGEVVITRNLGNKKNAEELMTDYIENRKFIYLPLIIEDLDHYENSNEMSYQDAALGIMQKLRRIANNK